MDGCWQIYSFCCCSWQQWKEWSHHSADSAVITSWPLEPSNIIHPIVTMYISCLMYMYMYNTVMHMYLCLHSTCTCMKYTCLIHSFTLPDTLAQISCLCSRAYSWHAQRRSQPGQGGDDRPHARQEMLLQQRLTYSTIPYTLTYPYTMYICTCMYMYIYA